MPYVEFHYIISQDSPCSVQPPISIQSRFINTDKHHDGSNQKLDSRTYDENALCVLKNVYKHENACGFSLKD